MKKILIFIFVIWPIGQAAFAQKYKFNFSIRGKAYAGPTSTENVYGRMFTMGTEYRIFDHHSVGVDYINFRNAHEDETLSTAGYYENAGTYWYTHRKYFLFDYRYYFCEFKESEYNKSLYVNLLLKSGKQAEWYYNGVGENKNIPWNYYSTYNEIGLAIGGRVGGDRFGVDLSIGTLKSFEHIDYAIYSPYLLNPPIYNSDFSRWKLHARINLFFDLVRIK